MSELNATKVLLYLQIYIPREDLPELQKTLILIRIQRNYQMARKTYKERQSGLVD